MAAVNNIDAVGLLHTGALGVRAKICWKAPKASATTYWKDARGLDTAEK